MPPVDACVYSLVGIHSDMISHAIPTRERIISAAAKLFYNEGIRSVSVDAVAEEAGVTKRTLYYHFASKDDLIGAYLEARDQPNRRIRCKASFAISPAQPAIRNGRAAASCAPLRNSSICLAIQP